MNYNDTGCAKIPRKREFFTVRAMWLFQFVISRPLRWSRMHTHGRDPQEPYVSLFSGSFARLALPIMRDNTGNRLSRFRSCADHYAFQEARLSQIRLQMVESIQSLPTVFRRPFVRSL